MAELGQTDDPVALVPGNPAAIEDNVQVLRGRTKSAINAGEGLRSIDSGSWGGPAATAFHDKFSYEPAKWLRAGDSLDSAAVAVEGYADTLRWAQREAEEAVRLWNQGEAATKQARHEYEQRAAEVRAQTESNAAQGQPPVSMPPFHDAGEEIRQQARETLERARTQLASMGDRTTAVLRAETEGAPEESSWLEDAGEVVGNFGQGVWDAVSGTAETVWDIIPIQAIWDPQGYADGLATMASGLWHSVTHPVEFAKSAVAWDTWSESPGRAVGQIVGGFALGGVAGKLLKGARAGSRASDSDNDGEPASSATSGRDLNRSLASESQMSGAGTPIAGAGAKAQLRVADDLAEKYSGNPGDWAKMSSEKYTGPDGKQFEMHWYENVETGERVEYKTKITRP